MRSWVALDVIRALAALSVLLNHVRTESLGPFQLSDHSLSTTVLFGLTRYGHEAVIVFFVLSGFLVGGGILSRFDLHEYVVARSTRILVPLIPAVLFGAVVTDIGIGAIAAHMLGLNEVLVPTMQTNGALWSIAYEIWFYVLGGALAYLLTARSLLAGLVAVIAGFILIVLLDPSYLAFWCTGAAASLLDVRYPRSIAVGGLVLGVAGVFVYQTGSDPASALSLMSVPPVVGESLVCLGLACALPWMASTSANEALARVSVVAGALSAFSYTLYLTHQPTVYVISRMIGKSDSMLAFGLTLAVCLVVATGFYWAFERNTPEIRRRLRKA